MRRFACLMMWIALLANAAFAAVNIDADNFPDEKFRQLLQESVGENIEDDTLEGGDALTDEQIAAIHELDFAQYEITGVSSLKGLEHLTALTYLNCPDNKLTELTLPESNALENLSCNKGKIAALDLSGATALKYIDCSDNRLTELDLSGNPSLVALTCSGNKLPELDLSGNGALSWLDCTGCELTGLNLSNNPALREVRCADNPIGELDLSKNSGLTSITLPAEAEVTLPNGDKISMRDFQIWKTKDGKYRLNLSRYEGKIDSIEARRADYSDVPVDVSGGVYTFDPCDGDVIVFYSVGEYNLLHLHIPNAPKDIDTAGGKDNGGGEEEEEEEEEVTEEIVRLSVKLVNNTDTDIFVALAGWTEGGGDAAGFTKGWYKVEPGKERTVTYDGGSPAFSYGFYANSAGRKHVWGGKPGDARYAGSFWVHPTKAFESHDGEAIEGGKQFPFKRLSVPEDGNATIRFAVK